VAEKCQTLLFSAYRLDQYTDPDSFMLQVAAVFSQYEDAVLIRATDPFRSDCLQQSNKFPPSMAEIRESLDGFVKSLNAAAFVAERETRGFHRDTGRGFGYYDAKGERYDPEKHRTLPLTCSIAPAD
jgi:hypothetical protein